MMFDRRSNNMIAFTPPSLGHTFQGSIVCLRAAARKNYLLVGSGDQVRHLPSGFLYRRPRRSPLPRPRMCLRETRSRSSSFRRNSG